MILKYLHFHSNTLGDYEERRSENESTTRQDENDEGDGTIVGAITTELGDPGMWTVEVSAEVVLDRLSDTIERLWIATGQDVLIQ